MDLIVVPCNMIMEEIGITEDMISDKCNRDQKEQQEYLGSPWIHALVNDEDFDSEKFGDESIKR